MKTITKKTQAALCGLTLLLTASQSSLGFAGEEYGEREYGERYDTRGQYEEYGEREYGKRYDTWGRYDGPISDFGTRLVEPSCKEKAREAYYYCYWEDRGAFEECWIKAHPYCYKKFKLDHDKDALKRCTDDYAINHPGDSSLHKIAVCLEDRCMKIKVFARFICESAEDGRIEKSMRP